MRTVDPADWRSCLLEMKQGGYAYLDYLTAVDRVGALEVVAHVVHPDTVAHVLVSTTVTTGHLDSITADFPGADWHERETAEMFGLVFDGHPDPRPLLLRTAAGTPPLLKGAVLAARAVTDWPGAAEAEPPAGGRRAGNPSRRRQRPPGVPEAWLADES